MERNNIDPVRSDLLSALQKTEQGSILIADDDPEIVELISIALKDDGWTTIKAYNGRDALHRINTRRVAALIIDMRMPEMDGYEVCLDLCKRGIELPVLVVTGSIGDMEAMTFLNVAKTLRKPFELDHVLEFVRSVLPGNSPFRRSA